jgi:hypothetical protein
MKEKKKKKKIVYLHITYKGTAKRPAAEQRIFNKLIDRNYANSQS